LNRLPVPLLDLSARIILRKPLLDLRRETLLEQVTPLKNKQRALARRTTAMAVKVATSQ
jgi:hypothetical protein